MHIGRLDFGPEGWARVIAVTALGTVLCIGITLYIDSFNFEGMSSGNLARAMFSDFFLPMLFCLPVLGGFMAKLRELAIAHRQLAVFASTDSLTQVMNRAAFSTLVDAYLNEVRSREPVRWGALIILDVDNFKTINDRYGHDCGDEALRTIAGTVKSIVRTPDIVGRLGGEEFGVFLPGAGGEQAARVAERIRKSVNDTPFAPEGVQHDLSVSVGAAVFDHRLSFSDLFRIADQQLYMAKREGRNRVAVTDVPADVALAA